MCFSDMDVMLLLNVDVINVFFSGISDLKVRKLFLSFFVLFIYCKAGRVTCPDGIVARQMRKGFLCLCARCSFYCRPTIILLGEGSARSTFRIETGIGVARYLVALDVGTRERALLHWGNVTENNFSILGKVGDDKENDTAFHLAGHG